MNHGLCLQGDHSLAEEPVYKEVRSVIDATTSYVPQDQVKSTEEGESEKLGLKKGIRGED